MIDLVWVLIALGLLVFFAFALVVLVNLRNFRGA